MKYIPQEQFNACIRYVAVHPEDVEKLVDSTNDGCPYIELPDNHGRIVDLDKVIDWLINEKRVFSMAMSAKVVKALADAPVIIKASATTPSRNHTCPYYQGVCGLDEDNLCYCNTSYEMCDAHKKAME